MKGFPCGLLLTGIFLLGCQKESLQGGPGASREGQAASTNVFTLKVPKDAVEIARGAEGDVAVSINRGKDFRQAVTLGFDVPEGVKVTPQRAKVEAGQAQREFLFKVTKDAAAGRHQVLVTGTPESGEKTTVTFTLIVQEQETK